MKTNTSRGNGRFWVVGPLLFTFCLVCVGNLSICSLAYAQKGKPVSGSGFHTTAPLATVTIAITAECKTKPGEPPKTLTTYRKISYYPPEKDTLETEEAKAAAITREKMFKEWYKSTHEGKSPETIEDRKKSYPEWNKYWYQWSTREASQDHADQQERTAKVIEDSAEVTKKVSTGLKGLEALFGPEGWAAAGITWVMEHLALEVGVAVANEINNQVPGQVSNARQELAAKGYTENLKVEVWKVK